MYDHPPESGTGVQALPLFTEDQPYYFGTAVRELRMYTRWRDRVSDWLSGLV